MSKTKAVAEERVEYQISPEYVAHWTPTEMLREIIANALDTGAKYSIAYVAKTKTVSVTDEGPGFMKRFLMLGGGEAKTSQQIGQFKEGLKLAMLVAARQQLPFRLETTEFVISRVAIEKTQLGGDGLVVYLQPPTGRPGTRVTTSSTQKQYDAAVQLFACAEAKGSTLKRATIKDPNASCVWYDAAAGRGKQGIYVNGVYVQRGQTLFSYNITGLAAKASQNRDRNVISWWDVSTQASDLLLRTDDTEVIRIAVEEALSTKTDKWSDLGRTWRHEVSHTLLWKAAVEKAVVKLGMKNKTSSVLNICVAGPYVDAENILVAKEAGWTVLQFTGFAAQQMARLFQPVFEASKKSAADKVLEPVAAKDLTEVEKTNIRTLRDFLLPFFGEGELAPIRLFSVHYTNEDSLAVWYKQCVWLRRSEVREPLDATSIRRQLNSVIHEMSHKRSGAGDRTRDFENAICNFASDLVLRAPENRGRMEALRNETSSWRGRLREAPEISAAVMLAAHEIDASTLFAATRKCIESAKGGWRRVNFVWPRSSERTKKRDARYAYYVGVSPRGVDILITVKYSRKGERKGLTACKFRPDRWERAWRPVITPFQPSTGTLSSHRIPRNPLYPGTMRTTLAQPRA